MHAWDSNAECKRTEVSQFFSGGQPTGAVGRPGTLSDNLTKIKNRLKTGS